MTSAIRRLYMKTALLIAIISATFLPSISHSDSIERMGKVTDIDPAYKLSDVWFCRVDISDDYLLFYEGVCPGFLAGDELHLIYKGSDPVVCQVGRSETCSFPSIFIKKLKTSSSINSSQTSFKF